MYIIKHGYLNVTNYKAFVRGMKVCYKKKKT